MGEPGHRVRHTGAGEARGADALPEDELIRLLGDPQRPLWRNLHRPVKIGHGSLIVEAELPLSCGPTRVAYKQYRPRTWWKSLCWAFRPSRAGSAWRLGHRLLACGIATARPLAICQPRRPWLFRTSYLATEWIEGAENLHVYGWRLAAVPTAQRLRRAARCAESLGRLVGQMHAAQIAHQDLKGANLLVAERADRVATYLIDVDGVRFRRRLGPGRRAANLARLAAGLEAHPWITRSLCRRFLRAYAAQFPPGVVVWKPLWRDVAARTRRIVRRRRRAGQEVL